MQTKKEDLKDSIIAAAEREFLIHGYQGGSMRAIARRANTTIGNIYHYFSGKAALLDEIIGTLPDEIDTVIKSHETFDFDSLDTSAITAEMLTMQYPRLFPIDLLLSPRFLIFLGRSDGTPYDEVRTHLIQTFNNHLKWHMGLKKDSLLTETILQAFLSSLLFIGTHMKNMEDGRDHLIAYIKVMSLGFPIRPADR